MVQKIGTIVTSGNLKIERLQRFEHHKIYVKVTNYVSTVNLKIEDYTIADNTSDVTDVINLNASTVSETIGSNGIYSYLLENCRVDSLNLNFISGDATLEIYYTGW